MFSMNKNLAKVVSVMLAVSSISSAAILASGADASNVDDYLYSTQVAESIAQNYYISTNTVEPGLVLASGTAVTTDYLNVRTGPSIEYDRKEVFYKGVKVTFVGYFPETNWVKVLRADGTFGYVYGEYLTDVSFDEEESPSPETTQSTTKAPENVFANGAITTGNLNLRSGPSVAYSVKVVIPKGETVVVYSKVENSNWYNVSYGNYTGYVSGNYLKENNVPVTTTTTTSTTQTIATTLTTTSTSSQTTSATEENVEFNAVGVVSTALNVRSGPDTTFGRVGLLYKYDKVIITQKVGDWYKINYGSSYGYVHGDYINDVTQVTTTATTTTLPVTTTTTTTKPTTSKPSTTFTTTEVTTAVSNVDDGMEVCKDFGTVKETLNVRSGPSTKYDKIGLLYSNTKVNVVGVFSSGWLKIEYSDGYAYVSSNFVFLASQEAAPINPIDDLLYMPHDIPLSAYYVPANLVNLKDVYSLSTSGEQMLVSVAADAYYEMYLAAKDAGALDKGTMVANSAYRSYTKQQSLYNSISDKNLVQKPGMSEHQYGVAIDIAQANYYTFEYSPLYQWLKTNSYKYGFVLRYAEDKQNITGISYEPWHYRYVGIEHAKAIYDSGLCLEEYVDSLK